MTAALRDRLRNAGVAGGSIYRDERPQATTGPAVVLFAVSDPIPETHDGPQALRETRVQVDCYDDSRAGADLLADAAAAVAMPAETVGDVRFSRSFVVDARRSTERPPGGSTEFRTSLDLMVWHQPAA